MMKNFIIKLTFIAILIAIIDIVFGIVFHHFFYKAKSTSIYKTNYTLKESKDDILLFGASETAHELDCNVINNNTGLSCYNMGIDGLNIFYHYAILNELLKRNTPKIVSISSNVLIDDNSTLRVLLPYCKDYPDIRKIVLNIDSSQKLKLMSNVYPYNSLLLQITQGMFSSIDAKRGYEPLLGVMRNAVLLKDTFNIKASSKTMYYFEEFVKRATTEGCKVFIFQSPIFKKIGSEANKDFFQKIRVKYNVSYLDFLSDTTFDNHPELFYDRAHLNDKGAKIFSSIIAQKLLDEKQ